MAKVIKILFYTFATIFLIWALLAIILSQVGIETKRFNSLIVEQVKKYNEDLNIDIKKVKIYLDLSKLTNPKLKVKSNEPTLIYENNKIEVQYIKTEIDILSYLKNNFIIDEFVFVTKDNKIKDLISIGSLEKPSLIIYNIFIKEGYASAYGSVSFDTKGNIIDYAFNGEIKDTKIKYNEKYTFKNINFEFSYNKKRTFITKANFNFKKIKFFSDQIYIPLLALDGTILVKGDIRTERNSINSNILTSLFENNFNFIKDQEITFETKNNFSFKMNKKKIGELKYSSEINLENITLNPKHNFFKNYFNNYKDFISLKNNLVKLNYENKNLNVEGSSEYSFDSSYDKIKYKITQKNNWYNFFTTINFDNNSINIKPIAYSKEKNKKSSLELNGSYNKLQYKFNEIIYNERKNFFKAKDLILDKNFKILEINKISIDYLNDNDKQNKIDIEKDLTHYNVTGKSFDSYKLINDILLSDSKKNFLDNFDLKEQTQFMIFINKVYLDDKNFSKNLIGDLLIKNNKINSLKLNSDFENNGKFKLEIKTLANKKKTTSFYSDNAEPFVKHFSFIKGFKDGRIEFFSAKEKDYSNSNLNIFDFKIKEMPALTKLLSLASLQGIADIMTGEGIRFDEFDMKFTNKSDVMVIDEIYAIGQAISILMSGYIEDDNLVSLRGTMVPATTINKTIAKIPILGDILIGKKIGEGVFGVSFKIKGPPKDLKTTVNPIKTLTPRFITRTLEKIKKNN